MLEDMNKLLSNRYFIGALVVVAVIGVGLGSFYLGKTSKSVTGSPDNQSATTMPQLPTGWERESVRQFDRWQLDCLKTPQGKRRCSLMLSAIGKQTKKLVFALMVSAGNNSQPILVVITPPAVLLQRGVKLTFGSKEIPAIPFVGCNGRFCRAVTLLDKDTTDAISQSNSVTAQFTVNSGRPIALKLQTNGFVDGYAAWQTTLPS
jgi:invasion protein IalB